MHVKCTGIVQYMLDLTPEDLKENSSTSVWIKASATKTLLLCVKRTYLRHYFWLHYLKSSEANRRKPSRKVAVCYNYDIWWKHCFNLSGKHWYRWNNRKKRKPVIFYWKIFNPTFLKNTLIEFFQTFQSSRSTPSRL